MLRELLPSCVVTARENAQQLQPASLADRLHVRPPEATNKARLPSRRFTWVLQTSMRQCQSTRNPSLPAKLQVSRPRALPRSRCRLCICPCPQASLRFSPLRCRPTAPIRPSLTSTLLARSQRHSSPIPGETFAHSTLPGPAVLTMRMPVRRYRPNLAGCAVSESFVLALIEFRQRTQL